MNLTDKDLIAIIEGYEKDAIGGDTGELASDRVEALDRYFGRPYGDEKEGRSQVVSKDLADAVDWIMPSLIRVFLSSDDFLRFDPVGPEDEQQAEQESDYTNHIIMKQNNGFTLLYDWFKDALLLRNGYVKHWWDITEEVTHETYTGNTIEQLTFLLEQLQLSGDQIDIVGQESKVVQIEVGLIETYDVKIRRTRKVGKVRIEPVPPDEVRVSSRTRGDLKETTFFQHVCPKTRSELIEMGLDKDFVWDLPTWIERDQEDEARDTVNDEMDFGGESQDKSTDEIEYKESYVRIDFDDDGVAELRRVVIVGNRIPEGDEWNQEVDRIPFSYLTPNRLPHRHVGLGLNDELSEIAAIKTALIRSMLDNAYFLNNVEWAVNERAYLEDFLVSRPGGLKRFKGTDPIAGSYEPVIKQPFIQHLLPVLDYVDGMKESRSGVGRNVQGLDPETLRKTTEGAARMALQQANAKIEMIARLFAETGVKDLALAVHELCIKHQESSRSVKLRNTWVQVNPQEWKKRTDMTVNVGLGTGSMEEVRSNLLLMAQVQQQAAQAGIVTPRNVYNLAEKISDNLGFKQQGMFFSDPDSPEVKQMQQGNGRPDPLVEAEQVKAQAQAQMKQMQEDMKQLKDSMTLQFEKYKFDNEHALNIAKAEIEAMSKMLKVDLGMPGVGTETQQSQPLMGA